MVQDANKLVVFGSQLLGVIIVIVGLWTQQSKLQTPRPVGGKQTSAQEDNRHGDRFARLWDDPLGDVTKIAVLKPPTAGPKSSPEASPTDTPSPTATPTASPTRPKVTKLLIWNIVDAKQIAEIKERRLRIRYAIVSALLSAHYLPARESLLSPLTEQSSNASESQKGKDDLIGYFETFRADPDFAGGCQRVTLIWAPKETKLNPDLVANVNRQIADRDEEEAEGEVELQVLHHGGSQDLADYAKTPNEYLSGRISFMRATITGYDAFRPIISDDRLIAALFDELSLRIPALNRERAESKDRPRIVVVGESDTKYSQAIKKELEKKFGDRANLEFYFYLRGLDGRSEEGSSAADSVKTETQEKSAAESKGGLQEKSLGTSQFDYLRRLAVQLDEGTSSRKSQAVSAVGILGSDIYDKMLVLQALYHNLPGVIFFTTDLDALYLEPENQSCTRNLVTVAPDSLVLNTRLPPMRDSYQTVLGRKVSELVSEVGSHEVKPHIFEIAPGKPPIELTAEAPHGADSLWKRICRTLSQPDQTDGGRSILRFLSSSWVGLIFWLTLANAFLVLAAIFTREARPHPKRPKIIIASMAPWARRFLYSEVLLGLVGIVILVIFLGAGKEPLLLGEPLAIGMSVWPSVMIRLVAFVVAILFLLIASYTFVSEGPGIREKLEQALDEKMENIPFNLPQGLARESLRLYRSVATERPEQPPLQKFKPQLEKFFGMERHGWPRAIRLGQIIGVSLIYFLFSVALFAIWPPSIPGRGAFALLTEKIVLGFGISLYIIHLIFCLDLHRTAFNFLRTLRAIYARESWDRIERKGARIKSKQMLEATSEFTSIIGKTLLYPLTVLILIILSRLRQFDNWTMTPSLTVTFLGGALALITASLILWAAGTRLKREVLARYTEEAERYASEFSEKLPTPETGSGAPVPAPQAALTQAESEFRTQKAGALKKYLEDLSAINKGVFAPWYNQPIFAALFSAAAVFGSLSVAGPIAQLFLG